LIILWDYCRREKQDESEVKNSNRDRNDILKRSYLLMKRCSEKDQDDRDEAVNKHVKNIFFFETGSHCVGQAGLELMILLLWSPECWNYKCMPLYPV
jgi:hypothetical protein